MRFCGVEQIRPQVGRVRDRQELDDLSLKLLFWICRSTVPMVGSEAVLALGSSE